MCSVYVMGLSLTSPCHKLQTEYATGGCGARRAKCTHRNPCRAQLPLLPKQRFTAFYFLPEDEDTIGVFRESASFLETMKASQSVWNSNTLS